MTVSGRALDYGELGLDLTGYCMHNLSEMTLCERIARGAEGLDKTHNINVDRLRDSIVRHLQRMFNTREGSVKANSDYGLPDFNDIDKTHGFEQAKYQISRAIKEHIMAFEPRFKVSRVKYIEDEDNQLQMNYVIVGRLNVASLTEKVNFSANLSADGIKVS